MKGKSLALIKERVLYIAICTQIWFRRILSASGGAPEIRDAADNAITTTEKRERRMIILRASLIGIYARHGYLLD